MSLIPGLSLRPIPKWLAELKDQKTLPICDLLNGSLYYPACGLDGNPVRYLGGFVHSFVYVDYGVARDDMLNSACHNHEGFRGYTMFLRRDVAEHELVPNGWKPLFPNG